MATPNCSVLLKFFAYPSHYVKPILFEFSLFVRMFFCLVEVVTFLFTLLYATSLILSSDHFLLCEDDMGDFGKSENAFAEGCLC